MLPLKRFRSYIAEHALFDPGQRVLLAVSGGKDSVLMATLFNAAAIPFGMAHCNFGLRGDESDGDAAFTEELSRQFGVPFYHIDFDTALVAADRKISIQMAARELRYQWLEQIRKEFNFDYIAVAHHQTDAVETVLLNLTRGTGISGMHGILPKRGRLIRPLLFLSGQEVSESIAKNKIVFREDSSNASPKYARNKIRHEVVPKLKELNPNLEATFEANTKRFTELEQLLNSYTEKIRADLFMEQPSDEIWIDIAKLRSLEPQRLLLFELFRPYDFTEQVLGDLISGYEKHAGRIYESATHQLLIDRERLILCSKTATTGAELTISADTTSFNWGDYQFTQSSVDHADVKITGDQAVACLNGDKLVYPLTIRQWQTGDSFKPLGMSVKKRLSDFFIGQKIPLNRKHSIPVFVNGNSDIIWVAGYRIDERYKVGSQTKKVTIFELKK